MAGKDVSLYDVNLLWDLRWNLPSIGVDRLYGGVYGEGLVLVGREGGGQHGGRLQGEAAQVPSNAIHFFSILQRFIVKSSAELISNIIFTELEEVFRLFKSSPFLLREIRQLLVSTFLPVLGFSAKSLVVESIKFIFSPGLLFQTLELLLLSAAQK